LAGEERCYFCRRGMWAGRTLRARRLSAAGPGKGLAQRRDLVADLADELLGA